MRILIESGTIAEKKADALVLSLFEGEEFEGFAKDVNTSLGGMLASLLREGDFTGKFDQILLIYTYGKIEASRLVLVGLGKRQEFNFEVARCVAGKAAQQIRGLKLSRYVTVVHGEDTGLSIDGLVQALVEGSELALYTFTRFKTETESLPKQVDEMVIFLTDDALVPIAQKSIAAAEVGYEAVKLARDIANTPSSDMTPSIIADNVNKMAEVLSLKCTILDRADMEKLGMGGLLNVSRGSRQPPKMVILEYYGTDKSEAPVVLVGKGITFDSGGISIKPSERMEEMKYDKSGAAAVIAVMQAVVQLKMSLNVVSIAPLTENLPSGSAYKPGDVLKHYGGKTSEIISTDAEGRLILADALAYAANYKPKAIIDLATLTSACTIALGTVASGLFSNNRGLAKRVVECGEETGEKVWELPLCKEYFDQIKSNVADIKNSGGRPAGAITAAAFLSRFVDRTPWAHVDIAGTAYTQEGSVDRAYNPRGATGIGVRLLLQLLKSWRDIVVPSL